MKKIMIFEPAMCCSTGVCGPSVDPELLRITTITNKIKAAGGDITRFNLTDNPMVFVTEKKINDLLNSEGVDVLPVVMFGDEVVKTGGYNSDDEMLEYLEMKLEEPAFVIDTFGDGGSNGCC